MSYLEVYNEQLRDLLAEDGTGEVHIREHPETGVYVEGLSEVSRRTIIVIALRRLRSILPFLSPPSPALHFV